MEEDLLFPLERCCLFTKYRRRFINPCLSLPSMSSGVELSSDKTEMVSSSVLTEDFTALAEDAVEVVVLVVLTEDLETCEKVDDG